MQIFSDVNRFDCMPENFHTAVAVGKFDGLHEGHQKLLSELKRVSGGCRTLVFTFDSPISDFFTGRKSLLLTTNSEKDEYLREMGIDYEFVLPVNEDTLGLEPELFLQNMIIKKLRASYVVAGPDLSFGKDGTGDFTLLSQMADKLHYRAVMVDKVMLDGEEISSSRVRGCVSEGNMEYSRMLLGHPYSVDGKVRHGRKIGRTLEMPTINIEPEPEKLLPPFGVYYSDILLGTERFHGITNIGIKPTVTDEGRITVETYIYDFDDDVYGENLRVELLHYHRTEQKFEDLSGLKKQMHDDMISGRKYFEIEENL